MEEQKINEVFTHNGVKLRVVEDTTGTECHNCYVRTHFKCHELACMNDERKDNKSVLFKLVEEQETN